MGPGCDEPGGNQGSCYSCLSQNEKGESHTFIKNVHNLVMLLGKTTTPYRTPRGIKQVGELNPT
jgi:hypothetical protein